MNRMWKSIAAIFMAVLMVVGLIPTDFTLVPVEAATGTYVLSADDLTAGTTVAGTTKECGTSNYFTLVSTDSSKGIVVDSSAKDVPVNGTTKITNRIKLQKAGVNSINFTVASGNKATLKVYAVSSNGSSEASLAVINETTGIASNNKEVACGTVGEYVFELNEAGTYKVLTNDSKMKPANIYYISVAEEKAGKATGTAPVIASATASLKGGNVAAISWTTSTAAKEDGKLCIDVMKGDEKLETINPDASATSYDYTLSSTGRYTFKVYGKLGSEENAGVTTSPAIDYVLPLEKPVVKAKAGDGKINLSWQKVEEATSYKVIIKQGDFVVTNETSTDVAVTSYEKTGLDNLKEYTITVEAVRTAPAASAVSDAVVCMPYKPVDTSSAIPGLSVINQSEDNAISISRTAGSMMLSQPASSGGIASGSLTNMSYVVTPSKITGDFTLSADITMKAVPSKGRGIFIGAVSDASTETKPYIGGLYMRGDNGGEFNAYRTKNQTSYNNGGSAKGKFEANKKYTVTVTRASGAMSIEVKDGDKDVIDKVSWQILPDGDGKNLSSALGEEVNVGIALCGATAVVDNLKIVSATTGTVFDASTLKGEFSSFIDNWNMVSAPVLSVSGDKGTMTVKSSSVIGSTGAGTVKVDMMDSTGKVVDTQSSSVTSNEQIFEFSPETSGDYSFVATASRPSESDVKTSNTVSVKGFVATLYGPANMTATSQGGGKVKVEWDAYSEAADGFRVSYKKSTDTDYIVAGTTKDTSYIVSGLTVGTSYDFKVEAIRGSETAESVKSATATEDAKFKWEYSAFGSSTDTKNNGYIGDANDGTVTVYSEGGKGKIVPNSTDGLSYYYTKIPTTSNFTLSAKVHADSWTLSNGQEGFGVMVSDRAGVNGDSTVLWNNSYQAIATKVEYYVDDEGNISDDGKKISMKLGLGVLARTGVTSENLSRLEANDTATVNNEFKTETLPLDTSASSFTSGTYNVIGNSTNTDVTSGLDAITDYYITIQKNNTGYFITYSSLDGSVTRTQKYYDTQALSQIDKDNVCAGFFASRNARATFSDISLVLTDPATDAPAEEKPIKYVTPKYSVTSATATGQSEYTLTFVSTANGRVKIEGDGVDVRNAEVFANVSYNKQVTLKKGTNSFKITFTPDANYVPKGGDKLTSYDPYTFTHTVNYKTIGEAGESIWVAPTTAYGADGSESNPIDIYTAVKYAQPGQQIILKAGTYNLSNTVKTERGNNGTANNYITMMGDPNSSERPVLDFGGKCAGMILGGDYWCFKGFDVTHSADAQKGVQVSGSHNVLDQINTYHNGNTGLQISRLLSSDTKSDWPSYNTILNCTSYGNADKGYEDADGFAAKLTVGDGNVFDGCIAYNNADDGWDLFAKVETGSIGSVTIQNCVAYGNGYLEDGTNAGNGNGFKMGGSSISGYHKLINSVSYNNKSKGIDSNSCPDIQVSNSTTFNNESYNVAFYTNEAANTDFFAKGVLSYRKDTSVDEQFKLKGTQDKDKVYGVNNYYWDIATKQSMNSAKNVVSDDWFVSLDTNIKPTRNANGTINMNGLLVLTDKAPAGVGARLAGRSSAVINPNPTVKPDNSDGYDSDDSDDSFYDNGESGDDSNPYKGEQVTIDVANSEVAKATIAADAVVKNAAGEVVSLNNVVVTPVPATADSETAKSIIEAAAKQGINIASGAGIEYYDITLTDKNGNPLTFEGTLTLTFAYPDGTNADAYTYSVLHLLHSGVLDIMDPVVGDNGLSVSVTELSPFAVVYAKKAADGSAGKTLTAPKTADANNFMIFLFVMAGAAMLFFGAEAAKKNAMRKDK